MLASLIEAPLTHPDLLYEPKYDGIRAIVDVAAGGASVRLWSRLGNEKTSQFPEIADAIRHWARTKSVSVVLDGEIVALDATGQPAGFQNLQGRIHLKEQAAARRFKAARASAGRATRPATVATDASTAFIAFDILRHDDADLRDRPLY